MQHALFALQFFTIFTAKGAFAGPPRTRRWCSTSSTGFASSLRSLRR